MKPTLTESQQQDIDMYVYDCQEMARGEGVALALPKDYAPSDLYLASKTLGEYMFGNMWR